MRVALDVRLRRGAADSFVRTSLLQEAGLRAVGVEPQLWEGGAVDAPLLWTPVPELAPAPPGARQLITLHDVNPLRRDGRRGPARWRRAFRFRRALKRALAGAAGVAAVSADAARAAERRFPGLLPTWGVVPHFPAPAFRPPAAEEAAAALARHRLRPGFLLYVGALRRHKNWEAVVEAWQRLPTGLRAAHPLVLVGNHRGRGAALLARAGGGDAQAGAIHHLQGVSDDELRALYGSCALFLFPSYLEGFGLPPLEAMACGAPVLASSTTSMPEVLGAAAAYADPWQPRAFPAALRALLEDPQRLARMRTASLARAAEYSPRRTGEAFLALAGRLGLDG